MPKNWLWLVVGAFFAGAVVCAGVITLTLRDTVPAEEQLASVSRGKPPSSPQRRRPDPASATASMVRAQVAFAAATPYIQPSWREPIDEVLGMPGAPAEVAAALYRLLPSLDNAAREEAVFEMVALVSDDNYAPAKSLLLDTSTSPEVFAVLLADLQHRPETLKLPLLAQLADEQPYRPGVVEILQKALPAGDSYRASSWSLAVNAYLAAQEQAGGP